MNRLLNAYFSHFLKNGLQVCSQKGGGGVGKGSGSSLKSAPE